MIFIGAELSDPHAHFVTNIVSSIGTGNDLVIDLLKVNESVTIFERIATHLRTHQEQYVIYNAYTDEDFFLSFKKTFPALKLITVFSDDEWRHSNYDRYLAMYADIFTIAVKDNLPTYKSYGLEPYYMQWACNPDMFYPMDGQKKDIDVSFIGAAYGQRVTYVKYLLQHGANIKVFGKGWDRYADIKPYWGGYLTHNAMLDVIARSKINLNFLWTSAAKDLCTIKGRTLELAACRAFQLSNVTSEFANYGFVDKNNIAVFESERDALEKIEYYLQHNEERDAIAENAYNHVLHKHTWKHRFQMIFESLEKKNAAMIPIHMNAKALLVVEQGVQHQVDSDEERFEIILMDADSDWQGKAKLVDGVVYLNADSTINNETLYMMLFALRADKSDMVAANFRVGSSYWIRFIDKQIERKRSLLSVLPTVCQMFSGEYAARHGCRLDTPLSQLRVSYIEHPSFWISLSYLQARKMRLYFAYHGDSRKQFKKYLNELKFAKALSLVIDKIWQRLLQKGIGV